MTSRFKSRRWRVAFYIAMSLALLLLVFTVKPIKFFRNSGVSLADVSGFDAGRGDGDDNRDPSVFRLTLPWAPGVEHTIAQGYGVGMHQRLNSECCNNDFYALDFDLPEDEPVYPVAAGVVQYAGPALGAWSAYGNIVFIDHRNGYQSLYAHLNSLFVSTGQSVTTNDPNPIGGAGKSGTEGNHLHFALYRGAQFQQMGAINLKTAAGAGPYGGESARPELFTDCIKIGEQSCIGLAPGDRLWRGRDIEQEDLIDGPVRLTWRVPSLASSYHLQVRPLNDDGPGVDMIISDPAMVASGRYEISSPRLGQGNYLLLPGATYSWRVRFTNGMSLLDLDLWTPWSEWQWFRTLSPKSLTLKVDNANDISRDKTPTIRWTDSNPTDFYYEVQLSSDIKFRRESDAIAPVFWNLVHGGEAKPLNSWTVPDAYALSPGTYYVRVRQRLQATPAGTQERGISWTDPVAITITP
ncbi:MAG: Murein hydrolase activator NlpD [Nitrospira sp.]|nr:Murein hydrolase activator NlpD [Nitrospira sp.]